MIIDTKKVEAAVATAIDRSVLKKEGKPDKVRKFDESIELILNIRELDIKNPNNRIEQEHLFPHPIHDDKLKLCFFVAGDLEMNVKKKGLAVVNNETLDTLNKKPNKDKKQVVKKYDYFVATADMMRNVAKVLARFLGQQNKMPKPQPKGFGIITPNENLDEYVKKIHHVAKLDMKKQLLIQVKVGRKSQDRAQVMENIESILNFVQGKLPNGQNNVKSIYVKTTMGPAIKVEEGAKSK